MSLALVQPLTRRCCQCLASFPATTDHFPASRKAKGGLGKACHGCYQPQRKLTADREVLASQGKKECRACHHAKELVEFSKNATGYLGLSSYCKPCNSSMVNQRAQRRIRIDWAERLIKYARTNRLKRGGKHERCDFDKKYLYELLAEQEGKCAWTGIQLSLEEMGKPWSISLDRIDCSVGYVRGNVLLTSRAANLARNQSSVEDFGVFISLVKEA